MRTGRKGSQNYCISYHTSLLLFKNWQLKAHSMVTGQRPGFSGRSAPLREAVSYTARGRFRQLPTSTAEARTSLHLLQGALLMKTLADVQGKHIPSRWPDSRLLGRNPTATRVWIAGLESGEKVWYRTPQHSKHLFPNNGVQILQENMPISSSQQSVCPYTHFHSKLHTQDAQPLFSGSQDT